MGLLRIVQHDGPRRLAFVVAGALTRTHITTHSLRSFYRMSSHIGPSSRDHYRQWRSAIWSEFEQVLSEYGSNSAELLCTLFSQMELLSVSVGFSRMEFERRKLTI